MKTNFIAIILLILVAMTIAADVINQPVNSWRMQYRKAAIGDVTHPYETGLSWDYKNGIGIVFGGHLGTFFNQIENEVPDIYNTNMTYAFKFETGTFEKIFPMDRPPKRCGPKFAYDEGLNLMLAFGGAYHGFFNGYLEPSLNLTTLAEEGRRSMTVRYQIAPWAFDGAAKQWYPLRPLILQSPSNSPPFYGFNINFAFAKEYGLSLIVPTFVNRVYSYSTYCNQWTLLPLNSSDTEFPPSVNNIITTYDLKHRKAVLCYGNVAGEKSTWSYDVGTQSWKKLAVDTFPTHGSPVWFKPFSCASYDRKHAMHIYLKDDGTETWALSLDSLKWRKLSPDGAPASGGDLGDGFVYDPVRNVNIVYSMKGDEIWSYRFDAGTAVRPDAPANLIATSAADRITLTWSHPSPAAAKYYVYRS
ncbi:MAG: hypothetical protein JNL74_13050, partial [Fibrobacteres bacterium]|nr:hypothetical protein [Fibrobacterota bacterium]